MALGETYATLADLKAYLGITDTVDDTKLNDALATASRGIEKYVDRQLNQAGVVSPRVYYPQDRCLLEVDDFHTAAGLIVKTDDDNDGVYETTWSSSDYQLEPLNGIVDGMDGWPYSRIRAVDSRWFPTCSRRASVQVTADWGWSAVPAPVKQACLIIAAETHKLKDAPFGVAGFGDFGPVRVRDNPMAAAKLAPYRRNAVMVA